MTLEGPAQGPDETPAPPARTRWSEESADDEPGLMPPYVPGGRAGESEGGSATSGAPASTDSEEPFPFEQAAEVGPAATSETEPPTPPPAPTPSPANEDVFPFEEPAGDDDFPFDAFDLGGDGGAEPEPGPEAAIEEMPAPEEPLKVSRSAELADRLQGLADALRRDGAPALEREMASGDRFRALVAGVVAGYMAGLEE